MKTSNRDRWLISYADFITLLFAFFTTLYAISTVDSNKLTSVAQGLQEALNTDGGSASQPGAGPGHVGGKGAGIGAKRAIEPQIDVRAAIATALGADLVEGRLELRDDPRGLILSIPEASAFAIGSADLSPNADGVIARLSVALSALPNAVRVEGHTDDVPIHTARFESNWDLSTARATRVVQLMIANGGLEPERLSAAGYSEFHPRAPNDSAEARARNRRVDIVILNPTTAREEPARGAQP